jgi:hypothetical protein
MGFFDQGKRLFARLQAGQNVSVEHLADSLREHLARRLHDLQPIEVDADLREGRGRFGVGFVQTQLFRAPGARLRKAVLTQISVRPLMEGFALVLQPDLGVDHPTFAADFILLPARLSVNAEAYGLSWQGRRALSPAWERFAALGAGPGPQWAVHLSTPQGLHAKLHPERAQEALDVLVLGLHAYLDALESAPSGSSKEGQDQFFRAFHANGPRTGPLRRVMGDAWAERYSRAVFS